MANVFLYPLDDEAGSVQVGTTLETDCELETLLPFVQDGILAEHLKRLCPDGKCCVWGVPERDDHFSTWTIMAEGDLVLGCHDRSIVSAAYVLTKIRHPLLAARLWGERAERSFSLMFFTSEPYAGEVPIVPQMRIYLEQDVTGFTRLHSEKCDNILRDYGSFETFVRLGLGYDFPFSFRHSE